MSKFHSTVSRRSFMKGLGLAGAGLGAAAAAAPVLHDLDEVAASTRAGVFHEWWVKERDHYDPPIEIEWSAVKPWARDYEPSGTKDLLVAFNSWIYPNLTPEGQAHRDAVAAFGTERNEYEAAGLASGTAPYDLRTLALKQGGSGYPRDRADWTGYTVKTPEERGVPKFSGTPEKNARTVRAAFALYGLHSVGFLEINEKFKKMSYAIAQRYEDTSEPYTDGKINVIPNSCRYAIVAVVRKEEEISRRWGKWSGRPFGYSISTILHQRAQMFVKALGYHCLKVSVPSVPFNVMCGNAELGRTNHNVAPDIGLRLCSTAIFATDLPLAPTKPVDAGIFRFCADCKKCATYCKDLATGCLPLGTEPTWETTGPWNQQGIKVYHNNWVREGGCGLCTRVCPFNHKDLAVLHDMVRATVAITPVFNGFFATMDDVLGYGKEKSMEEWWDRDLRTYPYDVVQSGDNRY